MTWGGRSWHLDLANAIVRMFFVWVKPARTCEGSFGEGVFPVLTFPGKAGGKSGCFFFPYIPKLGKSFLHLQAHPRGSHAASSFASVTPFGRIRFVHLQLFNRFAMETQARASPGAGQLCLLFRLLDMRIIGIGNES